MTNQEAITAIRSNWPTSNYTVLIEALEMAIKLLKEDDEYVATCEAWPYLSWLATEHDEALDGLIKLVASEIRRTILKTGE